MVMRSNRNMPGVSQISAPTAAVIAASALVVPAVVGASSTPTPNHPRILRWYKSLRQPSFKPPDALIPVAWTAIDAALAVGGYRLLRASPSAARSKALALWGWNVAMIGGWSRLFFKRQNLALSTVAAAGLAATSAAFVNQARQVDKTSANAGLPLVGWVAFATVLTAAYWRLNSRQRN
jgi:benzodiazapine receptor